MDDGTAGGPGPGGVPVDASTMAVHAQPDDAAPPL
jgi:hypothetical protein